jgi:hypothetical protein
MRWIRPGRLTHRRDTRDGGGAPILPPDHPQSLPVVHVPCRVDGGWLGMGIHGMAGLAASGAPHMHTQLFVSSFYLLVCACLCYVYSYCKIFFLNQAPRISSLADRYT